MALDRGHRNFYENDLGDMQLDAVMDDAKHLVEELEAMRHQPRRPYTIHAGDARNQGVVRRLTGTEYALPVMRRNGFINEDQRKEQESKWGQPPEVPPDEEEGTRPTESRRPPPTGGAPATALPVPAPQDTIRVILPEAGRPVGLLNPISDLDTGATTFLESTKPPKNAILSIALGDPASSKPRPAANPVKPPRKKSRRVRTGPQRLPSGRRDSRR